MKSGGARPVLPAGRPGSAEQRQVIDYALGTIPAAEVSHVERFLREHPEEAGWVRAAQDTLAEYVMSLPPEGAVAALEEEVLGAVRLLAEELPPPARRRGLPWAALALAAALGLAVWLSFSLLSGGTGP